MDKTAVILQMTFSNVYPWMKICEYQQKKSLAFVPSGPVDNTSETVQEME